MAEPNSDATVVDDDKAVTEADLRSLKYDNDGVETSQEEDEPTEAEESDETTEETEGEEDSTDDSKEEPAFVKKFAHIKGDTPEEYAKNLEAAYDNSTAEFMKLRNEKDSQEPGVGDASDDEVDFSNPVNAYIKQKMDEEIVSAYSTFSVRFPQVKDPVEYEKFQAEVDAFSQTIRTTQKRFASADELFNKAAVSLGWEPADEVTDEERTAAAVKDRAAVSKTSSGTKKAAKSKVTSEMIATHKKMYPGKSDSEIRAELEDFVT